MHSHRLRYTFLGLLIYIQSAFCRRICGTDFHDVSSKTYLADIVFEGHYDGIYQRSTGSVRNGRQSSSDETIRYNGMFTVQKVMKGELPRDDSGRRYAPVVAGEFGAPNPEDCVAVMGSPGHGRNSTYIVFLKENSNPAYPIYQISAYPVLSTRNNLKLVKKISCLGCSRPPRVELRPENGEFPRGGKITLKCKVRQGLPPPQISWRRDGVLVRDHDAGVHIRRTRKASRLQIRNAAELHEGIYECIAGNVVNPSVSTQAVVKVTVGSHKARCDTQTYCLNGGTCYILQELRTKFCECQVGFSGRRCELQNPILFPEAGEKRDEHNFDRKVTIAGIIIGCLIVAVICLISYCLAKKRKRDYHRQKSLKEREKHEQEVRRQAIENELRAKLAGIKGIPRDKNAVITAASAAAANPRHTKSSSTQTDDQFIKELENALYSRKRPSENSLKKHAYSNGMETAHSGNGHHEPREHRRRGSRESRNGASSHRNGDPYRNDERVNPYQNDIPHQQQVPRRRGSRDDYPDEPPPYNGHKNNEYYGNNHSSPVEVHRAKDDHNDNYRNGEMQRRRLPGMSTSANVTGKDHQNHPIVASDQAAVNAVMDNDRHSPPFSQNPRAGHPPADRRSSPPRHQEVHRGRESDSASRISKGSRGSQGESPNLSLEADQVSDYDNQQPSDMEVNTESGVASADEVEGRGDKDIEQDPDTSPVEDSSECESTSSSTNVEQLLFSKLKTNPKVTSLQNMHILDNSYNEWDNYGQPNYFNDPYAFNPYAIDDDYIKNPLLHGKHPTGLSRHRRHTSLSELQDRLLQHLTDDTDATPV